LLEFQYIDCPPRPWPSWRTNNQENPGTMGESIYIAMLLLYPFKAVAQPTALSIVDGLYALGLIPWDIQRGIAATGGLRPGIYGLGAHCRLRGNTKRAMEQYTKAWEENPKNHLLYLQVCQ